MKNFSAKELSKRHSIIVMLLGYRMYKIFLLVSRYQIIVDEPDASGTYTKRDLGGLVERLQGDLTHISLLGGKDLELLSDMDPESLADIMPDK